MSDYLTNEELRWRDEASTNLATRWSFSRRDARIRDLTDRLEQWRREADNLLRAYRIESNNRKKLQEDLSSFSVTVEQIRSLDPEILVAMSDVDSVRIYLEQHFFPKSQGSIDATNTENH